VERSIAIPMVVTTSIGWPGSFKVRSQHLKAFEMAVSSFVVNSLVGGFASLNLREWNAKPGGSRHPGVRMTILRLGHSQRRPVPTISGCPGIHG